MYFREYNNVEHLIGTRDLNINELVQFTVDHRLYQRRILNKKIVKVKNGPDDLIEVGVYTLSSVYGPLVNLKFTDINITDDYKFELFKENINASKKN